MQRAGLQEGALAKGAWTAIVPTNGKDNDHARRYRDRTPAVLQPLAGLDLCACRGSAGRRAGQRLAPDPGRKRGVCQYHAATLLLELFRKETESYIVNLTDGMPRLYVVLREDDEGTSEHDYVPFLVTASPHEAQDYLDSGEEIVEGIPMPPGVFEWLQAFVDFHHVEEKFVKRKRDKAKRGDDAFSARPPVKRPYDA